MSKTNGKKADDVIIGGVSELALMAFIKAILVKVGHEVICVPDAKSRSAMVKVLAEYDAAGSSALLLITRSTRAALKDRFDMTMVSMIESRLSLVV